MSAGTSYRRVAAKYHALSVVIGDEGRLGGSDVCLHLWGGNVNTDYPVHSKLTSNKRFKDYPTH